MNRSSFRLSTLSLILGCWSLGGCYTTTLRNGSHAAAPAKIDYDEKWHSGLIYGIVELSGPYDLSKICPNGWAEIKTETSFLNGLVQSVTNGWYNPQSVTVRCASDTEKPAAPPLRLRQRHRRLRSLSLC